MEFQTKLNIVVSAVIILLVAVVLYNFLAFTRVDEQRNLDLKAQVVENTRKIMDLQKSVDSLTNSVSSLQRVNAQ